MQGLESGGLESGGLESGSVESPSTDFRSAQAHTWESRVWGSRIRESHCGPNSVMDNVIIDSHKSTCSVGVKICPNWFCAHSLRRTVHEEMWAWPEGHHARERYAERVLLDAEFPKNRARQRCTERQKTKDRKITPPKRSTRQGTCPRSCLPCPGSGSGPELVLVWAQVQPMPMSRTNSRLRN